MELEDARAAIDTALNEADVEILVNTLNPDTLTDSEIYDIASNVAANIYSIENGGADIENVSPKVFSVYIERAENMIDKLVDVINDEDALSLDGSILFKYDSFEDYYDGAKQQAEQRNLTSEGEITDISEIFTSHSDYEDYLKEQGYRQIGDGLFISEEDYEAEINDPAIEKDYDPVD